MLSSNPNKKEKAKRVRGADCKERKDAARNAATEAKKTDAKRMRKGELHKKAKKMTISLDGLVRHMNHVTGLVGMTEELVAALGQFWPAWTMANLGMQGYRGLTSSRQ